MKRIRLILSLIIFNLLSFSAWGQRVGISTNAVDYANFGTLNAEASVAVARHWTLNAGVRYNPWTFGEGVQARQNRTRSASVGCRWWPWNVYSGWWVGARAQWEEYNRGGWRSPQTEEADAWGAAVSAGYSLMLHHNINLDFGLGLWGGYKRYTVYRCPTCGRIDEQGSKAFIMPSDLLVSLMFTF